jgi:cobalt-zinc-cadmium efflux system protein
MADGDQFCGGASDAPDDPAPEQRQTTHDHAHGVHEGADRRYLMVALGLLVAYMAAEVAVAVFAHSLALLADAGHMLIDAGALAGALWAIHLAARPSSPVWSYGLKRAEILAAAANGVALLVVGVVVGVEAIRRLVHPHHVRGVPMLTVALIGVAVNIAATAVVARADRRSLNIEGAFQHILTDLYGFIGTAAAAVVIISTGWERADPIASLVVVALVVRAAWQLLKASGHILLEGTPRSVDLDEVRRHLTELPEVLAVHDLHAWTLTSALPALTAHVVVTDACLGDGRAGVVLDHLQQCLADHFDVEHSTFQLEAATHAAHEPGTHE